MRARGEETYLGDGLYVSRDAYGTITLRAPRGEGDHYVVLEPNVLDTFKLWLSTVEAAS